MGGDIKDKCVTILGWAFKKDTNDSRESASISVAYNLLNKGAFIKIFDPMVPKQQIINDLISLNNYAEIESNLKLDRIEVCDSKIKAIESSDAIAILTEWEEFSEINLKVFIKKSGNT